MGSMNLRDSRRSTDRSQQPYCSIPARENLTEARVVRISSNTEVESDHPRNAPPNYFSRAQQYRLLTLVFTLLLVLFLMAEAAKPKNWQWMWQAAGGEQTIDAVPWAESPANTEAVQEVDTRLDVAPRQSLPPGVFVSEPEMPQSATELARDERRDVPGGGLTDGPNKRAIDETRPADQQPLELLPGVNENDLATIRDDTVFRSAEFAAWFSWSQLLRKLSEGDVAVPSPVEATFLQLYRQPNAYRGRLVRVSGIVRRAHLIEARPNELGIDTFYQCWLFSDKAGTNPTVVYAQDMPAGFPTGLNIYENVSFTGVFFKRWAYQAKGGIMTAPLVLTANGDWTPATRPPPPASPSPIRMFAAIGLAALIGGGISWGVYQQSRTTNGRAERSARAIPEEAPVLAREGQDNSS